MRTLVDMKSLLVLIVIGSIFPFLDFSVNSNSAFAQAAEQETEVQFLICEDSGDSFFRKLNMQIPLPTEKDIFYYETLGRDLFRNDVVIRTSHSKKKQKSTLKVKNLNSDKIPWHILVNQDYKCEYDLYLGLNRYSCSINNDMDFTSIFLSPAQIEFVKETRFGHFNFEFKKAGPVKVYEFKFNLNNLKYNLETSNYKNQLAAMELSTRVKTFQAIQVQSSVYKWLQANNILLCPDQNGKIERVYKLLGLL